jgi:hypothetical protein
MTHTITLFPLVGDFGSDKDLATKLRQQEILPHLIKQEDVILDFTDVTGATQSFIHALIAEPLQLYGQDVLLHLKFKSASPIIRNLIKLVIDYTLIPTS